MRSKSTDWYTIPLSMTTKTSTLIGLAFVSFSTITIMSHLRYRSCSGVHTNPTDDPPGDRSVDRATGAQPPAPRCAPAVREPASLVRQSPSRLRRTDEPGPECRPSRAQLRPWHSEPDQRAASGLQRSSCLDCPTNPLL